MSRLWSRLRAMLGRLLGGDAGDTELSDEIRAFVEHDADSKIQSGMAPEEARRATLIELGGAEQVKERVREHRAGASLESLARDIRYAVRSLGQARAFSFSVIGSLCLGLAATIVAFAFINGALLRPFPGVRDQDRLVEVEILRNGLFGPQPSRTALTDYPEVFLALNEGLPSLEDLASFTDSDVAVGLPEPRSLRAAFVSGNYFDVLGVRPEIGRTFAPEEGNAGSAVAVIAHGLWIEEFGGDASVIGRSIRTGGQSLEIIGVAPRGFRGTSQYLAGGGGVDLWLPMALAELAAPSSPGQQPGERWIRYLGRVLDGIPVERVETELAVVVPAVVSSADDPVERFIGEVSSLSILDRRDALFVVSIILSVPLFVLAISCANAANLLLVRASRRGREVALRLALGSSRARLVRQLVLESLALAMGAALLALPLAWSGLRLLATFMFPMPLDPVVLVGALATAFLTALAFGLVPALQATGQEQPSAVLGTSPAGSGGTRSQTRGRRALVAGQVALSLGLLAVGFQLTAGLESVARPRGSDPDRLLLASFDLEQLQFSSVESDAFYEALGDGASRIPEVEAAGLADRDLLWTWEREGDHSVVVDSRRTAAPASEPVNGLPGIIAFQEGMRFAIGGSAGGDLFRAAGLDLLEGREFVATDRRTVPEVAIVTERLAAQTFQGSALGRTLRISTTSTEAVVRIVGIVESPTELSEPNLAHIFFPSPVHDGAARTLYLRADGPAGTLAPAVRDLVARLDPEVPILEIATLDQKMRADTRFERTLARAAAVLGIVALLLAGMGLYGVTSYSVAMRRREIAVRMALGARADRVVGMVLRQALAVAMVGSVLGCLLAIGAGRVIQAEVFGVASMPLATLGVSAALLAVAMLLASIFPARRAARLDPNVVLRDE